MVSTVFDIQFARFGALRMMTSQVSSGMKNVQIVRDLPTFLKNVLAGSSDCKSRLEEKLRQYVSPKLR